MCKRCMMDWFETVIKTVDTFPPRWSGIQLDPRTFRHIGITRDFLARYDAKNREWGCPPQERVYCGREDPPCSEFLGRARPGRTSIQCHKCSLHTCAKCRKSFPAVDLVDPATGTKHYCDASAAALARMEVLGGKVRGKDYQICPNTACGHVGYLEEACNHITCFCDTEYCYVCGQPAEEGYGYAWPRACPFQCLRLIRWLTMVLNAF